MNILAQIPVNPCLITLEDEIKRVAEELRDLSCSTTRSKVVKNLCESKGWLIHHTYNSPVTIATTSDDKWFIYSERNVLDNHLQQELAIKKEKLRLEEARRLGLLSAEQSKKAEDDDEAFDGFSMFIS